MKKKKNLVEVKPVEKLIVYIELGANLFLTLLFMTLKLFNVVWWSWIWVFSPIWIPVSLFVLAISLLVSIVYGKIVLEKI